MNQTECLAGGIINRTTSPVGVLLFATAIASSEKYFGCGIEMTGVAFIGINMDFQLGCFVGTYENIVKNHAAIGTADFQLHHVTILDAVIFSIEVVHMDVPCCTNDTAVELDTACWPDKNTTRRALDFSAVSDRSINAKSN